MAATSSTKRSRGTRSSPTSSPASPACRCGWPCSTARPGAPTRCWRGWSAGAPAATRRGPTRSRRPISTRRSAAREAIVTAARARTAPLLRRVRALTAAELIMLGVGLAGLLVILRRRAVRVDEALVPPPWRLGDGLVVLVRGAGAGVLVLVGVYLVGRWRGPN